MNPNGFVVFAHSIPLWFVAAVWSLLALLLTVPSVCGGIVGLLWGLIGRAVREREGTPGVSWGAVAWLLVRAWAISVLLVCFAFVFFLLLSSANMADPSRVGRIGGTPRLYGAAIAAMVGFALNVLLVRASVVRPFAANSTLRSLDTGIVLCALLVHLGYLIGYIVLAAVDKHDGWGPYVFAVIGGLIGFVFPLCRMWLLRLSAPGEQTVSGDERSR